MVLSQRERYIVTGLAVVLGVLALDRLAIEPLLDSRAQAHDQQATLTAQLDTMLGTVAQADRAGVTWRGMIEGGLKSTPGEAESQVNHALLEWSRDAGLKPQTWQRVDVAVRSSRSVAGPALTELTFNITGNGKMDGIVNLLKRIQTATIPIKASKVTMSSRTEGTDDLNYTMVISTVYYPSKTKAATSQPAKTGGGR